MMKAPVHILDQIIAIDASADRPLHTQLRRSLHAVIEQHFKDGDRFFTESELIKRLHLSQGTVRRALTDLAHEGRIERRVAKGSFVCRQPQAGEQTRSVGIFLPSFESEFWSRLMEQFSRLCRQMEFAMSIYHTERGAKLADAFRCLKRPPKQERVVLLGGEQTAAQLLTALDDRGYRTIVLDTPMGSGHAFVGVDNHQGILMGLKHLMDLGHREIGLLINERADHPNVALRVAAYRSAMTAAGLRPIELDCGCQVWQNSFEVTYQALDRLFMLEPRPTALFAVSDAGAWATIRWCTQKGIRIPEELSIVGFDDDRPSRFVQPALTSVAQPVEAIVEAAMRTLWDDSAQEHHEVVTPNLVVRASTGPPRQNPAAVGR